MPSLPSGGDLTATYFTDDEIETIHALVQDYIAESEYVPVELLEICQRILIKLPDGGRTLLELEVEDLKKHDPPWVQKAKRLFPEDFKP